MYATEHPSLPPMKERAADSLGTLLRSLRELRYAWHVFASIDADSPTHGHPWSSS